MSKKANLRYKLRKGKFGCYFFDSIAEIDLNLEMVLNKLNRLQTTKEQYNFLITEVNNLRDKIRELEERYENPSEKDLIKECEICHDSGKLDDGGSIVGCYKCGKDWRTDSKPLRPCKSRAECVILEDCKDCLKYKKPPSNNFKDEHKKGLDKYHEVNPSD